MEKIENALSNTVYLDRENNTIIKNYSQDKFKQLFGSQEASILTQIGIKIKKIEVGQYIELEYIPHEPFNDENISLQDLTSVVNALKKLHSLSTKGLTEPGFKKVYLELLLKGNYPVNGYLDEFEKDIAYKALKLLSEGKQVVLHNDVVEGNLLKTKDGKITLIDFEYGGVGNYLFDIASFLTERELSVDQKSMFVWLYDKNIDMKELNIVCAFLQIFWARWALFKYETTQKEIYKIIADWKLEKYELYKKIIA